ncbi:MULTISPECIES: response regulator [Virgibacillus]|jgi:two-component system, NarL family, response regulator NreC|uniref:DNA-binding response regulator n=1 Tax=Virgibacillus halodenitrificans TaxID=1482 RepID=A0AAC9NJC9_VIRHA|nr:MULTISPECIES: response regulator transcription factor [Virgibacillus]AIF42215.1 LuxR family transcriptional regulator [Virgibacillus sp. SK37]APC46928.1 DNA-binding response regulator [Virgibacillus halodenitrificans]MBD1222963.1 response regulator transcription factor [Virgibacillus halodenitrificans]MYL47078.1 response regulator [Virgibacillus halodenitrificans]MYL57537.1 response regulator [Virgibacillus halodenitrificans]
MIRILLVDDHAVVRMGLKVMLNDVPEMEVVGEASEGNEGIEKALEEKPDIVLMDLSMPHGKDGLSATSELKKQLPDTAILILTMHDDEEYLFRAIQAGASGCVLKSAPHQELIEAIKSVCAGNAYLHPSATKRLMDEYIGNLKQDGQENYQLLSDREKEVLTLIAKGYSNKEIGEKLVISVKTVEAHKSNLMEKLQMKTRPELVSYALKKGLLGYGI